MFEATAFAAYSLFSKIRSDSLFRWNFSRMNIQKYRESYLFLCYKMKEVKIICVKHFRIIYLKPKLIDI